jgi:UDP-N-acetylglucosamine 2-epimerase (non-hydrolysing)
MGIPTAHVEAGLRSGDVASPFPEEFNRRAIALTARYHFAPTDTARENLLREGIDSGRVFVTGNTVVDAVKSMVRDDFDSDLLRDSENKKIIFFTAHRRENHEKLEDMLLAVRRVAEKYEDVRVIYPVHPNPKVKECAYGMLGGCERIRLCEPLGVVDCHNILARSYAVLTDSGGLQEEAAALGVPVLVMRENTERPEGVASGIARLVGTNADNIFNATCSLLDNYSLREKMSRSPNPYGEGSACKIIADILMR